MPEDSFKTRARRGIVGFFTIVFGVLVALAADEWVNGLEAKSQRDALVTRLLDDLRADSSDAAHFREFITAGLAAQHRLIAALDSGTTIPDDSVEFIVERAGRAAAWPTPRSATFIELTTTGTLSLIPDSVRPALLEYYHFSDVMSEGLTPPDAQDPSWLLDVPAEVILEPARTFDPSMLRRAVLDSPGTLRSARQAVFVITSYLEGFQILDARRTAAISALEGR